MARWISFGVILFSFLMLCMAPGTAWAVDEVVVEELQVEVTETKAKADGNNSRIQALESKDEVHEAELIVHMEKITGNADKHVAKDVVDADQTTKINTNETKIVEEILLRETKEAEIELKIMENVGKITQEKTKNDQQDSKLLVMETEIISAQQKASQNSTEIKNNKDAITAEHQHHVDGDAALQSQIDAEASARQAGDDTLQTQFSTHTHPPGDAETLDGRPSGYYAPSIHNHIIGPQDLPIHSHYASDITTSIDADTLDGNDSSDFIQMIYGGHDHPNYAPGVIPVSPYAFRYHDNTKIVWNVLYITPTTTNGVNIFAPLPIPFACTITGVEIRVLDNTSSGYVRMRIVKHDDAYNPAETPLVDFQSSGIFNSPSPVSVFSPTISYNYDPVTDPPLTLNGFFFNGGNSLTHLYWVKVYYTIP